MRESPTVWSLPREVRRSMQSGPVMSWNWKESGDPRQEETTAQERKHPHPQSDWRARRQVRAPLGRAGAVSAWGLDLTRKHRRSCWRIVWRELLWRNVHFRKASLPNFLKVFVVFEGSFGTPHFPEALYLIKIFLSYKLWCPERHLNA